MNVVPSVYFSFFSCFWTKTNKQYEIAQVHKHVALNLIGQEKPFYLRGPSPWIRHFFFWENAFISL